VGKGGNLPEEVRVYAKYSEVWDLESHVTLRAATFIGKLLYFSEPQFPSL
jgi:hypothetical protein